MSAHKKKGGEDQGSGVVVGDGKHKRRHYNLHLKLAGLVVFCAAALLLSVYGTVALIHHFHGAKPGTTQSTKQTQTQSIANLTPEQKADYLMLKGDYTGAQKIYDSQLKAAKSNQDQASAYTAKATVAFSEKDYSAARTYASHADGLAPSAYTAEFLGDITSLQGDKKAAAGYYQTALNRLDKKSNTYGYVANKIQAKLNGVNQ
jgi:tetratricopeptide (TPR) repeat protein